MPMPEVNDITHHVLFVHPVDEGIGHVLPCEMLKRKIRVDIAVQVPHPRTVQNYNLILIDCHFAYAIAPFLERYACPVIQLGASLEGDIRSVHLSPFESFYKRLEEAIIDETHVRNL